MNKFITVWGIGATLVIIPAALHLTTLNFSPGEWVYILGMYILGISLGIGIWGR